KQAIIDELAEIGIIWEALEQEVGKDMDPFDMICHVVYDQPPLTRKERADNVKKRNYFTKYSDVAKEVLSNLLEKYADAGVSEIESITVLKVAPFNEIGRPTEIIKKGFGDKETYLKAVNELESEIYQTA
ncbi:type I restriction-modification enzyme R subunit C-terminal domain-containing protein, partial [Vibrio cholerae]